MTESYRICGYPSENIRKIISQIHKLQNIYNNKRKLLKSQIII